MKHKFLMLALLAMFTLGILPAWGQVGEYSFSATTGTFTPITGGVLLGTETSDDQRFVDPATPAGGTVTTGPGLDIGFNFTFNGAVFDRLAINNNGWISLGQSALTPSVNNTSSSAYTPIASTSVIDPPVLYNRIAALGRDLQAQTGASLRLETIGTAPNRVCVVQWLNYKKYGTSGTGDVLNFQIQLHETTNNVKIVYGVMTPNATAGNFQVGLRGPLATDFNARQGSTGWTNTTAATANTQYVVMDATNFPANGLTFNFDFPVANQAPNPANLVGPPDTGTLISPTTILSWLSGGGLPNGYRLSLGTNNPPTNILNNQDLGAVTNYDPNPDLQIATTYYWKVVPYNAFGDAANCPVWSFTTHGDPTVSSLPYTQNFDTAVTPPALPFDWTSIVQSSATAASVNTYGTTATYAHSLPNCARLQNSTDASAVVMLVGPQIGTALTPNTIRVKFWARAGSASNPVSVGMMTNPADPATYVELQNIPLTTTVAEYVVTLTSYTGEGRYFAFKHGLGGTSRTIYLDDVSFEQIAANDLAAVSVTGNSTPTSGVAANYTVNLYNWGTATQNTYTVNLMSGDTVLATAPGTTIAPGTSAAVVVTWTPTAEGPVTIYGKVVLAGDINPANDTTSPITVAVQPAGAVVVTIGEGNEVDGIPYDFYYKNSIHEALYYEAEFSGVAGSITAVTFYNNFVSDLQNMPIKLWLGTTQLADLSAGWILPDQLTMVYNGTINLPAGQNSIVVPLQTPYLYTGGNLVLYANRPMDTQFYNTNDNFQVQTIGTNRGRILRSDSVEYDPANPSAAGTLSGKFAKTSFTFVVTDMGSLAGTVTSGTTLIEGAALQIIDTNYATTTSTTGQYNFPFLPVGNYQVSASKIGYETLTLPVTISDGVVSTLNFNLTPSANIIVSGTLRGSDAPTVGLVGATISLDGPVDYQGTSGAGGNFSIPGVLTGNTYNYIIEMVGYADLTGTITVGTTNYNMGTLIMTEEALPPVQIVATENTAQTQVALTWRPPGSGGGGAGEEDFEIDNGGWVPSSNWTNPLGDWEWGNNYDLANFTFSYTGTNVIAPPTAHSGTGMWGTKFLTNYTNSGGYSYLTKTFNFTGVSNAQLKFWSWENIFGNFDYAQVSVNGTLVWGPSWDYTATQWRERVIDLSAYDGISEVVIQFQMFATTTVNYAGWYIDDVYVGPAQTPVVRTTPASVMPAAFSKLSETDAAAMAENLYRSTPRERATQSSSNPSRSLIGYKVWRFIAGNENNEASWTLLTTANITDTTYVDLAWGAQTDGLYRWAVKGIYTNNVQGPVGFSNIIRIERNNLAANTITGSTTPTMGTAAIYTIGIENVGTQAKAAGSYTVKLMNGATELASVPGPNIAPAEELVVDISWTPSVEGPMALTGKVVLPADTAPANDVTSPLNISVMPAGVIAITVGDGSAVEGRPVDFYYKNSLFETLYYPTEIGMYGRITALSFYNNFVTNLPDKPTKIWLGETQSASLADGWILPNNLTLVYDGNVSYPSGENTVTIPLQVPFNYTSGNLVLYAYRPWEETNYNTNDNFRVQTVGSNRARKLVSSTTQYDPAAPSAAGTLSGQFPMTTFHMTAIGETPMFAINPASHNYGTVLINNQYDRLFTISNAGGGALTVSSISLTGDAFFTLQNLPTLPATINFGQELEFTLRYNPTAAGAHTATITVVDNMTRLPHTVLITANAIDTQIHTLPYAQNFDAVTAPDLPPDWSAIIQSTSTSAVVATYNSATYAHSAPNSVRLYNPSDAAATLILLAPPYDNTINTNTTRVKFWARSSSAGYPLSVGVLTNPTDPATYTEVQNLALTTTVTEYVVTLAGYAGTGRTVAFKHGLGGTGRSLYIDDVMLEVIPQNDLAITSLTGNFTPTAGAAATYTANVFNWGSNAQSTYEVKLYNAANTELATAAGVTVAPGAAVQVPISFTPAAAGQLTIYAKVILAGDQNNLNDQSPNMTLEVQPEGTYMLVIGDGSQQARTPIDMYYKSSIFETIYLQSEINVGMVQGMINAVTFRKNFTSSDIPADRPIQIWLGTTTQTDLATDWIPASALTQVFNGTMNFTAGEGTVTFNFPTPYLYLGGNLVMMVFRPQDTQYYDTTDNFYAQTIGTNRTRKLQSDSTIYDPNAPTGGTPTGQFPQTFFHIIPGGVGHVNGTVRGPGNTPLAGVTVSFDHGGYNVTTNAQGQYAIQNVIVDDYQVSFSKHGYITQTLPLAVVEDQTHTLDATLALMPQVQVTGTILASDTGAGLAGATIYLTGYENYNANSTATGSFTFPAVFANQTYNYNIVCPGYMGATGTINVGAANLNMGQITLAEVAYPPTAVVAEANTANTEVSLSWTAPDPNSLNITEGFENATFPPVDWTQVITNTGPANANGVFPTWGRFGTITIGTSTVAPTEGAWQAGLWWSYEHQDEWLITPSFGVPPQAMLSFDSYVFLGSTAGDHYYVKASVDNGQNWTILWDASAQTGGWNYYTTPITVDLASYAGQQIKLAWNAVDPPSNDGLWYTWFIDDVYIGNQDTTIRFAPEEMSFVSTNANRAMTNTTQTLPSRAMQNGSLRGEPALPRMIRDDNDSTRALTGYKVWRLTSGNEATPDSWTLLTAQDITLTELTDPGWGTLANGDYRWAVKAVYTNNVLSAPAFSNILHKETLTGMISGLVRQTNNQPIPGATVTAGTYTATTNNSGAYVLIVPTGVYTVTASAANYQTGSQADVTVVHNQTTTVNFNLIPGSDADDPNTPVASTTLVGNYPNPFNPRTTLRYDLKDNSHVRIDIYNYRGQLVKTLVNTDKAAGRHSVDWDGTDQQGMPVSSGVYYYKMFSGSYSSTRKMVLMK